MMTTIYSAADVARLLGVTTAAVSNYLGRHTDTPAPTYVNTAGRLYWDRAGMSAWLAWQSNRRAASRPRGTEHHGTQGKARAVDAIASLRDELGAG